MPMHKRVPLEDLFVDEEYQRKLDENNPVLKDKFDPKLFEPITGSERANGSKGKVAVIAGQHRLERARREGHSDILVYVHTQLEPGEEARIYRLLQQKQKLLTPLDVFKSRLVEGDEHALGIKRIVTEHKLLIGTGPSKSRTVQAIVALERVYRRGNLPETLTMVKSLWEGEPRWLDGSILDGMSRFLDLFSEADEERCKRMWAEHSPTVIYRRAQAITDPRGGSRAAGVLEVLRELYVSREFRLPTVAAAQAQRIESNRAGVRSYKRVTGEQVRDAALELLDEKEKAGEAVRFFAEELAEKLGISTTPLTRQRPKPGFLTLLVRRGTLDRRREAGVQHGGRYYYEHGKVYKVNRPPADKRKEKAPRSETFAAKKAVAGTRRGSRRGERTKRSRVG